MSAIGYLETFTEPLDRARKSTFRWAAKVPWLRAVLYSRERRIAWLATVGIAFAFVMVVVAPVAMMAVSPAVFGVPHLASDVRYLVLRQELPQWWHRVLVVGCALLLALRSVAQLELAALPFDQLELGVATAWVAGAAVAGAFAAAAWRRLAIVLPVLVLGGAYAVTHPSSSILWFAHLHNVIAIVLWLYLFRRQRRSAALPVALLVLALALLLSGATLPLTDRLGGTTAFGLDLAQISTWFAPGAATDLALGIALTYIFLQSIHYAVWMGWIPQEELPGRSTQSWRASLRSLTADFGELGLGIIVALVVLVVAASLVNLHGTRNVYLSLAAFHGYLELAMLSYFAVGRRGGGR